MLRTTLTRTALVLGLSILVTPSLTVPAQALQPCATKPIKQPATEKAYGKAVLKWVQYDCGPNEMIKALNARGIKYKAVIGITLRSDGDVYEVSIKNSSGPAEADRIVTQHFLDKPNGPVFAPDMTGNSRNFILELSSTLR